MPNFLRYGLVAGSVALGYLALYALFVNVGVWYVLAITMAQAVAIPIAFSLYRSLVFGPGGSLRRDFSRFLLIWSSGAIAGFIATPILVETDLFPPVAAHVIAVGVVGVASFVSHKVFSFRSPAKGIDHEMVREK